MKRDIGRAALVTLTAIAAVLLPVAGARAADNIIRTVDTKTWNVATPGKPRGTSAKTAIVLDAGTGRVLFSKRVTTRRLIASTTKIMTALVAISRTTPNEKITAINYRAGVGESLMGLKPGERLSAQDLIRGLLLESGNDAAETLAVGTGTSRAGFIAAMNRRAQQFGLRNTHFANPVGLDSPRNYSTAYDLAKLAQQAITVPRFANTVDKARLRTRTGIPRTLVNRNPLIAQYRWAVGVKTGHTLAAGYLLVGAAKKLDARVISVVTGEPTEAAREDDSARLLKFGRRFYREVQPLADKRSVYAIPVALQDRTAKVYPTRDVEFAVRNGETTALRLDAPTEIEGPRSAGSTVGSVAVIRGGKVVATVPVKLGAAVPKPPISAVMLHALGQVLPWLLAGLLVAGLCTILLRRRRVRTRRPGFVG